MKGSTVDVWTRAIIFADPDSDVIIHAAPTDCINPPKFDAMEDIQIARKIGIRSGEEAGDGVSTSAGVAELMDIAMPQEGLTANSPSGPSPRGNPRLGGKPRST